MTDVSPEDRAFLARSINLARDNVRKGQGGPFGAIIVRDGQLLCEGTNQVTESLDPTAHAEVVAIRLACRLLGEFRLDDCTLYASCEPCPMCLGAVHWSRMGRLLFAATRHEAAAAGFDDEILYRELVRPLHERAVPTWHVPDPRAEEPFLEWQTTARKVPY